MSQNSLMASCEQFVIHSLGEFVQLMRDHFPWVMIEVVDANHAEGALIQLLTSGRWESKPVNDDEDARLDQNFYQVVQDYLAPNQTATFQQAVMLRGRLTFMVTMVGKEFIYVADDSLFRAAMAAFSAGSFGKVRDIELPPPEKKSWYIRYNRKDLPGYQQTKVEATSAMEAKKAFFEHHPDPEMAVYAVIPADQLHLVIGGGR